MPLCSTPSWAGANVPGSSGDAGIALDYAGRLRRASQPRSAPSATPATTPLPAAAAMTDTPPVVPARLVGVDVGPACQQCGGIMQRTGSCYTCPSCGNNTGCG